MASPYSHPDAGVRQQRFEAAVAHAAYAWKQGLVVFSPIAHSHPIALHGLDGSWEQWAAFDRAVLSACDAIWVLRLHGWSDSKGVAAELEIARELGLPVTYVDPL